MRHVLFGTLVLAACGNPAGSESAGVRVTMEERTTGGPARTVITVTNQERNPIFLGGCGVWIEAFRGGEWRVAYSPSCAGGLVALDPGTSLVREYAFLPSDAYPPANSYRPAVGYRRSVEGDEILVYGASVNR